MIYKNYLFYQKLDKKLHQKRILNVKLNDVKIFNKFKFKECNWQNFLVSTFQIFEEDRCGKQYTHQEDTYLLPLSLQIQLEKYQPIQGVLLSNERSIQESDQLLPWETRPLLQIHSHKYIFLQKNTCTIHKTINLKT